MKKHSLFVMLGALVLCFGLAGCGGKEKQSAAVPKVGVSLPTQREERWVRDKVKMEQVCGEIGLDFTLSVADNDAAKQAAQCDSLIAAGAKVLVVAPQDAKASAAIVEKAHKAGVKVIAYDRMILDADVDLYVSFDNVKVGEQQGEYITKLVPRGTYVVLSGSPDDNNAKLFRQGAMKYLQPLIDKKDITVAADEWIKDWRPDEAQKVLAAALAARKNKIDAVLAPNDGIAGACVAALSAQHLAGKVPVTGQDAELAAAQRIIQGTQCMTVYKNTRKLGAVAIQAALAMATGQPVAMINGKVNNGKIDVPAILCEPVAVDKSNLDSALIVTEYLKKEDVYKK
ncbi:MAG TPA: substrate-binding domain-containing protein [Chitinivibrionales bacterium]|nr:substrate-binding domain-containing protein [Chitinivibrionales bacterium]